MPQENTHRAAAQGSTRAVAAAARGFIKRGFQPVPVEPRDKAGVPGWEQLTLTLDDVPEHFKGDRNIGLRLGAPSGGLVDVDLDCEFALKTVPQFLPPTGMVSGRPGSPRSHMFYCSDLHESEQRVGIDFQHPNGKMICQLRFGGNDTAALTVVPPSVHKESGELTQWYEAGDPARAEGSVLKRGMARGAAASLLAESWPAEGGRHAAAMVADGFLTRLEWSQEERAHFLEVVSTAAGDDEAKDRKRTSEKTAHKLAEGKPVPGFPAMCEVFGEEVARRVAEWLEYPGWENEARLAQMNSEYCVIQDGGKTRILRFDPQVQTRDGRVVHRRRVPTFMHFGDFHNYYKNEFVRIRNADGSAKTTPLGNWWTGHPGRRTHIGLTFRPDLPDQEVDGRLNLWCGWGVQPAEGDWSLMKQHINEVIAAGDAEADEYILNWLAWAVQHPDERAQVALVLKGGRGTGKGTLGNALCHIFGQHATHISSVDHLAGRFNAHLRDACLLFADEAYWPGDKSAEGTLKRLITEPTLFIEAKGRDGVTVPNMLHVVMASNSEWVVPAGEHERRYAVFDVSEEKRQDEGWFAPLYHQLENGGYAAMLHDLLRRELGDWHPRRIPITEALRQQQRRSLEPLDAWVLKFFEDGVLPTGADDPSRALSRSQPDIDGRNPRNGLYDLAREQPQLRRVDEQVLAAHLKDEWRCTPWRSSAKRGWEFPPLAECRTRWEERFPGWAWQHPDVTEWQADDDPDPNY